MQRQSRNALALLGIVAALGSVTACAAAPAASSAADPKTAESAPAVPVGLVFTARLDRSLSSEDARVGDHLTATLDEPLRASDGTVSVPAGTQLRGRVLAVERGAVGRVTLELDDVYLDGSALPISARIVTIEDARVVAAGASDAPTPSAIASATSPATLSAAPTGGGPSPELLPLEIAAGAKMQLQLTRPFERRAQRPPKKDRTLDRVEPRIDGPDVEQVPFEGRHHRNE